MFLTSFPRIVGMSHDQVLFCSFGCVMWSYRFDSVPFNLAWFVSWLKGEFGFLDPSMLPIAVVWARLESIHLSKLQSTKITLSENHSIYLRAEILDFKIGF